MIYRFKDVNSNKGVHAIWPGTSENKVIQKHKLSINRKASTAQKVGLTEENPNRSAKHSLNIANNTVLPDVPEKTTFILVDNIN